MDFEYAAWQMVYLIISPQKVYDFHIRFYLALYSILYLLRYIYLIFYLVFSCSGTEIFNIENVCVCISQIY